MKEEKLEMNIERSEEKTVEEPIRKPVEETIENTIERRTEKLSEISAQKSTGSIRMATPQDASAIAAIYEPYIRDTAITFEYDPVSAEVMSKRITEVMKQFPWLVYEREGRDRQESWCFLKRWGGECRQFPA
jgi:hypothetical protein